MLSVFRDIQIPLLAVLLIGACAAKARRVLSARGSAAVISPIVLFPLRLRRPLAIALCTAELAFGIALAVTIGSFGAGLPAMLIRALAALLFLTAVGTLHELRTRSPQAGCGCFGDLSHTPVSWRVLTRSVLLSAAALATVTAPPARWITSPAQAWLLAAAFAAELGVLAALSPEVGEAMVRLGYSEPCELRVIPAARTLSALRASVQWRRYYRYLATTEPSDVWREGCWRFVVFPGIADGKVVDIVFAVYMQTRRPPIRAALVDVTPDQTAERISAAVPVARLAPDGTEPAPDDTNPHFIGRLFSACSPGGRPLRGQTAVLSRGTPPDPRTPDARFHHALGPPPRTPGCRSSIPGPGRPDPRCALRRAAGADCVGGRCHVRGQVPLGVRLLSGLFSCIAVSLERARYRENAAGRATPA